MGSIPRSVAARFLLELDGVKAGFVKSVEGGDIVGEVVAQSLGPDNVQKKHVANVRYEEFVLGVEPATAGDVVQWIADSWAGKGTRRSGAIVEADQNLNEKARRDFRDALITETTIPALDGGAAKTPGHVTVKIASEEITRKKASGVKVAGGGSPKQKQWLVSNFRLELDGLDTKRVAKIDAFTVKQTVAADDIGTLRDVRRAPTRIEFPNLRVTLAESAAQTWNEWFDDFVVRGNNGDDREKNGAIVFLDATAKQELGRIELGNVGIFALRRSPSAGEQVPRVTAELYVESMKFAWTDREALQPEEEPELAHAAPA